MWEPSGGLVAPKAVQVALEQLIRITSHAIVGPEDVVVLAHIAVEQQHFVGRSQALAMGPDPLLPQPPNLRPPHHLRRILLPSHLMTIAGLEAVHRQSLVLRGGRELAGGVLASRLRPGRVVL